MDLGDLPFTLVVKAPNQRVSDHTIECKRDWTVGRLKQHLTTVYPSKPKEKHQKLIYSGKLLLDHVMLKDVLREQETQSEHTVHLVCSPGVDLDQSGESTVHQNKQSSKTETLSSSSQSISNESLRHRVHSSVSTENAPPVVPQPGFVSGPGAPPQPAVQSPPQMVFPPGTDMLYTQEQYMMMMQNYYYQMAAQYMQYQHTGLYPTPPPTPAGTQEEQPNVVNNPPQPAPARDNNNMVMNAQGGMVPDDDDDDFGQRDWLDYVHTLARFMVLVSIVYFYSSLTRFFVVFAFFFIVYLYQTGWFQVRRRPVQNENDQNINPNQEQQIPETPEQPQQQMQQEQQQQQQQPVHEDLNPHPDNEEGPPVEPAELERPGFISVAWCFVSTFFTSLIPQPPPAVNAN